MTPLDNPMSNEWTDYEPVPSVSPDTLPVTPDTELSEAARTLEA